MQRHHVEARDGGYVVIPFLYRLVARGGGGDSFLLSKPKVKDEFDQRLTMVKKGWYAAVSARKSYPKLEEAARWLECACMHATMTCSS